LVPISLKECKYLDGFGLFLVDSLKILKNISPFNSMYLKLAIDVQNNVLGLFNFKNYNRVPLREAPGMDKVIDNQNFPFM
jgi:hypothetical protein